MQVKDLRKILDSAPADAEIITNAPDGTQPFVWVGLIEDTEEYQPTGTRTLVFFEYYQMPFADELQKNKIKTLWQA